MNEKLTGDFIVIEDAGSKPYDFNGLKGVSHKIVLRPSEGADREVKASPNFDFTPFLGEKVTVVFELLKGGFVRALSVIE